MLLKFVLNYSNFSIALTFPLQLLRVTALYLFFMMKMLYAYLSSTANQTSVLPAGADASTSVDAPSPHSIQSTENTFRRVFWPLNPTRKLLPTQLYRPGLSSTLHIGEVINSAELESITSNHVIFHPIGMPH